MLPPSFTWLSEHSADAPFLGGFAQYHCQGCYKHCSGSPQIHCTTASLGTRDFGKLPQRQAHLGGEAESFLVQVPLNIPVKNHLQPCNACQGTDCFQRPLKLWFLHPMGLCWHGATSSWPSQQPRSVQSYSVHGSPQGTWKLVWRKRAQTLVVPPLPPSTLSVLPSCLLGWSLWPVGTSPAWSQWVHSHGSGRSLNPGRADNCTWIPSELKPSWSHINNSSVI